MDGCNAARVDGKALCHIHWGLSPLRLRTLLDFTYRARARARWRMLPKSRSSMQDAEFAFRCALAELHGWWAGENAE
jgi:hypothetical protein